MREMLREAIRSGFTAVHGDVLMANRAMLLLAVLVNLYVKNYATTRRA